MRDPLDWEELGYGATLSRRCPLEQSGKVRQIDDLSRSQINSTVTCYVQATVDGPVVISAFCTFLMRCLAGHGRATKLVGRFLQWAAALRFKLPLSCYFDDFVSFACLDLAKNTQATLCLMLDILGWSFDREGPKSDDSLMWLVLWEYNSSLLILAMVFLNICCTEKRKRETLALLDGVMAKGTLQK